MEVYMGKIVVHNLFSTIFNKGFQLQLLSQKTIIFSIFGFCNNKCHNCLLEETSNPKKQVKRGSS